MVLLTGASGYVGGRLLPLLEQEPVQVRCLVRAPGAFRAPTAPSTTVVAGDVLDPASLGPALDGVHTAYYLVHLMSGPGDFEAQDRAAAAHFAAAARQAGVQRIIYLGGLGDDADPLLSAHLRSRHLCPTCKAQPISLSTFIWRRHCKAQPCALSVCRRWSFHGRIPDTCTGIWPNS